MKRKLVAALCLILILAGVVYYVRAYTTLGWKTYRNDLYGFEFKYPRDHTPFEDTNQEQQILIPATTQSEMVEFAENESHVFCCEPATIFIDRVYNPGDTINSSNDIMFAGKPAKEIIGSGSLGDPYRIIRVYFDNWNLNIVQNTQDKLLNRILSTFKFIGPSIDITGMDIYTNERLGFSIAVPREVQIGVNPVKYTLVEIEENPNENLVSIGYSAGGLDYREWTIRVYEIKNVAEIDTFIKNNFTYSTQGGDRRDSDCGTHSLTPAKQEGVFDVDFDGSGPEGNCHVNYLTVIKYYPSKGMLIHWNVGRDSIFGEFNDRMIDSFKFL